MISSRGEPPLVSAVVPVHNGAGFVADAIDSVLSQNYAKLECIVVDDGSTDPTPDVLRSFGSKIRVISQPNRGVAAARNAGASKARGSLLAFLDADDVWLPTKTTLQVELLSSHPEVALSYTGMTVVDSDLSPIGSMPCPSGADALRNALLLDARCVAVAQTGMVKKDVFMGIGGFDEALSTSADTDLVCRVSVEHQVAGIDEPLVLYRQHGAQMHLNLDAMERDMARVFERIYRDPRLPAHLRALQQRSWGKLWFILGASYFRAGDRRRAIPYLRRAAFTSPGLFWDSLSKRLAGAR